MVHQCPTLPCWRAADPLPHPALFLSGCQHRPQAAILESLHPPAFALQRLLLRDLHLQRGLHGSVVEEDPRSFRSRNPPGLDRLTDLSGGVGMMRFDLGASTDGGVGRVPGRKNDSLPTAPNAMEEASRRTTATNRGNDAPPRDTSDCRRHVLVEAES